MQIFLSYSLRSSNRINDRVVLLKYINTKRSYKCKQISNSVSDEHRFILVAIETIILLECSF